MLLYFSPAVSPIQIIPNLDPIIVGPNAKPILPHIFTFDNYLFKRCFLFSTVSKTEKQLKSYELSEILKPNMGIIVPISAVDDLDF